MKEDHLKWKSSRWVGFKGVNSHRALAWNGV